jgi:putative SOS response-associated peptidase YedK
MCYHFSQDLRLMNVEYLNSLAARKPTDPPAKAQYHVVPSALITLIRNANGTREWAQLKLGLIPRWNTQARPHANARVESLDKPGLRDSFQHRRCLIPANGYFEWVHEGKKRHPYFVRPKDGGVFAYAGIWDTCSGPEGTIESVAILTVPANELIAPMHDRMPAILTAPGVLAWLDPKETDPAKLLPLLTPFPAALMEMYPVSPAVNKITSPDGPDLIARLDEPPKTGAQPSLFDGAV